MVEEELGGFDKVWRNADVTEYGPHISAIEARDSGRKIEEEECAERVRL